MKVRTYLAGAAVAAAFAGLLAFAFTNGKNEIWTMSADGSHLARVVAGPDMAAAVLGPLTWSPDGRRRADCRLAEEVRPGSRTRPPERERSSRWR